MGKQVGIWIDHREAFVIHIDEGAEGTEHIESGMEKHVRFSGHATLEDGPADDQVDRQYTAHLDRYYDGVIAHVRAAQSILLFGPGEAKGELEKRLASKGLGKNIVGVEPADKMTLNQIVAKVRQYYRIKPAGPV